MSNLININEFLVLCSKVPVVDVRSPVEFAQGHISGAINIPLFDNAERAIVGTLYKKSGQKTAILAGLEIAGRKMRALAEDGIKTARNKQLIIHCWRGGMRSASVAWLFETCGIQCYIVNGGYKSYRQFIREYFSIPFNFLVLGGLTGSGKSEILEEIEKLSYQVLKLEILANHKGSVFGNLGEKDQNTNEQFENDIFASLCSFDSNKPIFIEDESRNIGRNSIPAELFKRMAVSPLIFLDVDKKLRIKRLVEDYGNFPKEELKECIEKISKRLGGQNARLAISSLHEGKTEIAAGISLFYYDKTYNFGLSQKKNSSVFPIQMKGSEPKKNAIKIIEVLREKSII